MPASVKIDSASLENAKNPLMKLWKEDKLKRSEELIAKECTRKPIDPQELVSNLKKLEKYYAGPTGTLANDEPEDLLARITRHHFGESKKRGSALESPLFEWAVPRNNKQEVYSQIAIGGLNPYNEPIYLPVYRKINLEPYKLAGKDFIAENQMLVNYFTTTHKDDHFILISSNKDKYGRLNLINFSHAIYMLTLLIYSDSPNFPDHSLKDAAMQSSSLHQNILAKSPFGSPFVLLPLFQYMPKLTILGTALAAALAANYSITYDKLSELHQTDFACFVGDYGSYISLYFAMLKDRGINPMNGELFNFEYATWNFSFNRRAPSSDVWGGLEGYNMFQFWNSVKDKKGFSLSSFFANYYNVSSDLIDEDNKRMTHKFLAESVATHLGFVENTGSGRKKINSDIVSPFSAQNKTTKVFYTDKIMNFAQTFYYKDTVVRDDAFNPQNSVVSSYRDYDLVAWDRYSLHAFAIFEDELKNNTPW